MMIEKDENGKVMPKGMIWWNNLSERKREIAMDRASRMLHRPVSGYDAWKINRDIYAPLDGGL